MNSLEAIRRQAWDDIYNENFNKNVWGQVYDIVKEAAGKDNIMFVTRHIFEPVSRDSE